MKAKKTRNSTGRKYARKESYRKAREARKLEKLKKLNRKADKRILESSKLLKKAWKFRNIESKIRKPANRKPANRNAKKIWKSWKNEKA